MDMHKQFTDRIRPTSNKSHVDLPFEPNVTSFQQWADSLPILNPRLSASMMTTASQALLSADINPTDKLHIAEAAQPCLLKLLSACNDKIEGAKLPFIRSLTEIFKGTIEVLTNLRLIYIDIACSPDFMSTDVSKEGIDNALFSDEQKSLVICRAIEMLRIIQFVKSLIYKQVGNDFWANTNALLSFAESLDIHQLSHLTNDGGSNTSVEDEFKKIQYFHLANTNRLGQRDIKAVQRILALQASDILMSSTFDESSSFYIDLSSSSPINHIAEINETNNQYRFMNNEQLEKFMLSEQVVAAEKHGAISLVSNNPILPKKTISKVLSSWSTQQNRQVARQNQTEEITIYPGFESIIRALILKKNPDYFGKKVVHAKKNPLDFGVENLRLIPMEDHQKNHHSLSDTDMNRALKATAENALSDNSIWGKKSRTKPGEKGEEMEAKTNDSSLQGLRFKVSATNKPLLKASDLIGVQAKTGSLQLAIIRRINNLDDGDVSVGIEMMSPHLKIANIKFHDEEQSPKPVIFLQGVPAINQPDSIISPLFLENTHEDIVLKTKDKMSYYSIDKTIETNQVFSHYTVSKGAELD